VLARSANRSTAPNARHCAKQQT